LGERIGLQERVSERSEFRDLFIVPVVLVVAAI
jgi:hypothetical protein